MSPLSLSLPVMKAMVPSSRPVISFTKFSSLIVMVMFAEEEVPGLT